ncbi:hypothetical protein CK820_G0056775, partial [Pan troglodytes]
SESTEPLSVDGISSDLEEPAEGDEEEEEEEGGMGPYGLQEGSPQTPDQEQFLKQHFETLASGAAPERHEASLQAPSPGALLSREIEAQDGLGSLPPADGRPSRPHSYQNPTTSSMANISRSISVGENLGLVAEPQAHAPIRVSPLSKLALPSRAHLVLDIPKPLPDRPTLAAFSPVTKGRAPGEAEKPGFPVGLGKAHSTTERWACLGEGTTPKPRTECQAHPGPSSPCAQQLPVSSLFQGPENLQPPPPEKTPNPMECTKPGAALSQDSGP